MFKNSESKFSSYFELPNPSLVNYFDRVRKGSDVEFRTSFYRGLSPTQVLTKWMPTLRKCKSTWPTLWEFEIDLAKKVGPMSIMKPLSERMNDIRSYYTSILQEAEPLNPSAVAAFRKEWSRFGRLELRSQVRTVQNMKLSTNSGCPYFTKRRAAQDKTIPLEAKVVGDEVVQDLPNSTYLSCAVLGWRGQEGGPTDDDVKQRVVWMFPFGINVRELQFYQPAIELTQRLNLVPAWVSMEAVDHSITRLFDTKGKKDLIVGTDFDSFDQHFNASLQACARTLIRNMLNHSPGSQEWIESIFPIKYLIPLAIDMGCVITGPHGMGSGSGGTNFDETLVHRVLQYECAIVNRAMLNPYSQCLGDDGILSYPGITVEDVVASYTKHGLAMNESKQYASAEDCTFLRRWHHTGYRRAGQCVGCYSTCRALGRLCEQERYYDPKDWGPEMVALRQLSIIENCKYHPLAEEFLQFCMKGDRYKLGIELPGFLDNIERIAKEAIDTIPDFLGYSRSLQSRDQATGIGSWWVVKRLNDYR